MMGVKHFGFPTLLGDTWTYCGVKSDSITVMLRQVTCKKCRKSILYDVKSWIVEEVESDGTRY